MGFTQEFRIDCDPLRYVTNDESLPANLKEIAKADRQSNEQNLGFRTENMKNCPNTSSFIQNIFNKIVEKNNLQKYVSGDRSLAFHIACDENIYASTGHGIIYISKGIVELLGDENAIAFALSHELAHHLLLHDLSVWKNRKDLEFDADILGQKILIRSGYKVDGGITFLKKIEFIPQNSAEYSSIQERITLIYKVIKECSAP